MPKKVSGEVKTIQSYAEHLCRTLDSLTEVDRESPTDCEDAAKEWTKDALQKASIQCGKTTVTQLQRARIRVRADGWYGPISDDVWKEEAGYKMPMKRAKCIVREAMNTNFRNIEFYHPDYESIPDPDYEEGVMLPNAEVSGDEVVKEMFRFIHEIYGGYHL